MKKFTFKNDNDVTAYIKLLIKDNLNYHFDDEPVTISWVDNISPNDIGMLQINHLRLIAYCDPWEFFDKHEQLWDSYRGAE